MNETEEESGHLDLDNESQQGEIFGIERFCTGDGPGIRTVVFFKGCPLRCAWCHNPESMKREQQILFDSEKCLHCGSCAVACRNGAHRLIHHPDGMWVHDLDRSLCNHCGECAKACTVGALESVGRSLTVDEVLREVLLDEIFYRNSGGGLTVSGGEPMAQIDFLHQLLVEAKNAGLHVAVETSGFCPWPSFARILPLVDLFLFDFKESDPERHRQFTGQTNETILYNLMALDAGGARIQLQCPIVPGFNEREDHLLGIASLAERLKGLEGVRLLPYHPLGMGKRAQLGLGTSHAFPSAIDAAHLLHHAIRLKALGVKIIS